MKAIRKLISVQGSFFSATIRHFQPLDKCEMVDFLWRPNDSQIHKASGGDFLDFIDGLLVILMSSLNPPGCELIAKRRPHKCGLELLFGSSGRKPRLLTCCSLSTEHFASFLALANSQTCQSFRFLFWPPKTQVGFFSICVDFRAYGRINSVLF